MVLQGRASARRRRRRPACLARAAVPHNTAGPCLAPQGEDDGGSLLSVADYLAAREGERPVGVYALYDARRNLQYVGYSRNVVLSVRVGALALCAAGGRVGELRSGAERAVCTTDLAASASATPEPGRAGTTQVVCFPLACAAAPAGLPMTTATDTDLSLKLLTESNTSLGPAAGPPGSGGGGAMRLGAVHGVCQQGDAGKHVARLQAVAALLAGSRWGLHKVAGRLQHLCAPPASVHATSCCAAPALAVRSRSCRRAAPNVSPCRRPPGAVACGVAARGGQLAARGGHAAAG